MQCAPCTRVCATANGASEACVRAAKRTSSSRWALGAISQLKKLFFSPPGTRAGIAHDGDTRDACPRRCNLFDETGLASRDSRVLGADSPSVYACPYFRRRTCGPRAPPRARRRKLRALRQRRWAKNLIRRNSLVRRAYWLLAAPATTKRSSNSITHERLDRQPLVGATAARRRGRAQKRHAADVARRVSAEGLGRRRGLRRRPRRATRNTTRSDAEAPSGPSVPASTTLQGQARGARCSRRRADTVFAGSSVRLRESMRATPERTRTYQSCRPVRRRPTRIDASPAAAARRDLDRRRRGARAFAEEERRRARAQRARSGRRPSRAPPVERGRARRERAPGDARGARAGAVFVRCSTAAWRGQATLPKPRTVKNLPPPGDW